MRGQPEKIASRKFERHRNVQHDFQHDGRRPRHSADKAAPPARRVSNRASQFFAQVGKHAARTQSQQRNRDRQKCEVVKEHHREQARQRQFQQQRGKTAEGDAGQQRRRIRLCG